MMHHSHTGTRHRRATAKKYRCPECEDKGWIHAFNTDTRKHEIQRCDDCEEFDSDAAALLHVKVLAERASKGAQNDLRNSSKRGGSNLTAHLNTSLLIIPH